MVYTSRCVATVSCLSFLIHALRLLECTSPDLIDALIEHCIQPRCLISPMDADFCAQFVKLMHKEGTPNFHTLRLYDKLLDKKVGVMLSSCTEYEAKNYGNTSSL